MDIGIIVWIVGWTILFMVLGAIRIARRCNESFGMALLHETIGVVIMLLLIFLYNMIVG